MYVRVCGPYLVYSYLIQAEYLSSGLGFAYLSMTRYGICGMVWYGCDKSLKHASPNRY